MIIFYYLIIISIVNHVFCLSVPQVVVPTAPEQAEDEMENQIKPPHPRPDAPPDYSAHFVPGRLNIQKGSFPPPEIPYC